MRIATAIRRLGAGLGVLFGLGAVGFLFSDASAAPVVSAATAAAGILVWGAGLGIAWIIEGFAPEP